MSSESSSTDRTVKKKESSETTEMAVDKQELSHVIASYTNAQINTYMNTTPTEDMKRPDTPFSPHLDSNLMPISASIVSTSAQSTVVNNVPTLTKTPLVINTTTQGKVSSESSSMVWMVKRKESSDMTEMVVDKPELSPIMASYTNTQINADVNTTPTEETKGPNIPHSPCLGSGLMPTPAFIVSTSVQSSVINTSSTPTKTALVISTTTQDKLSSESSSMVWTVKRKESSDMTKMAADEPQVSPVMASYTNAQNSSISIVGRDQYHITNVNCRFALGTLF
jgi:hypothetical protein